MATIIKRGPRSHQARIRRIGYPTLTRTFDTRADAEKWAREQEHKVDRGTLPDTLEARRTTLADALRDYRLNVTPLHKGALVETNRILAISQRSIAALPLASLTDTVIEKYISDRMKQDGVSGSTVNRELGILVQVLKRARKKRWMVHNPMIDVDRPPNSPGRERRLSAEERKQYIAALQRIRNKSFRAFVLLASETGMRRGELLAIQWAQVQFSSRTLLLSRNQTKNGTARKVPLSRKAVVVLRWLRRKNGKKRLVFEGLSADAVKKCWQRLRKFAGIPDYRLHDLRHERVSSLIDAGWSVINAMAVSGHKDMKAFRGYAHPNAEILAENLDKLTS